MTEQSILAVDPGSQKSGLAVLNVKGDLLYKTIVSTTELFKCIESIIKKYHITNLACGNGTNHKFVFYELGRLARTYNISLVLVDEAYSTEEARKLYWEYNPPKGLKRLIPKGMLFPGEPVDDLTAYVIGKRYLKTEKE